MSLSVFFFFLHFILFSGVFFSYKNRTFLSFTLPLSAPCSELPLREAAITTHGRAAAVMSQAISRAPTAATSPTARLSLLSSSCSSIALLSTRLFFFNLPPCFHSPSFFHKSYSAMLNVFFFSCRSMKKSFKGTLFPANISHIFVCPSNRLFLHVEMEPRGGGGGGWGGEQGRSFSMRAVLAYPPIQRQREKECSFFRERY